MTKDELGEMIRMLQAHSPLVQLSYMEAVTVFELMEQRGFRVVCQPRERGADGASPADL